MNTLPTISKSEIETASKEPHELISLLVSRYRDMIMVDSTGQIQHEMTAEQNVLMAFDVLDGQVSNGGFIQLIENGYGSFIFDTPLSEHLREWGAEKIAALIDQARPLYEANKEVLERKKTLQEFAKMYQEHPEFDALDKEFCEVIDGERGVIVAYIMGHLEGFVDRIENADSK